MASPSALQEQGPSAIDIEFEAHGLPEARCGLVVGVDHGVEANGADARATVEGGERKLTCDSCAARARVHGEPVEVAAPSVPPDDQCSDQVAVAFGDQQRLAVVTQEPRRFLVSTGMTGRATPSVPQIDDPRDIFENRTSD
jgi:hypothetical protein